MNIPGWQPRRLVPRWRSLLMTTASGELGHPVRRGAATDTRAKPDLLARLERWHLSPTLINAAELVESAIVSGREMEGIAAARMIIDGASAAAPLVKTQAASLLMRAGLEHYVPGELRARPTLQPPTARKQIQMHPRDALAWVELAFAQTSRGHPLAAAKSMNVALHLAPHNRHVLRSASRLLLHLGDKEHAHNLIRRNDATSRDPWLIAAEISLAEVAETSPKFLKVGSGMLDSEIYSPHHLTELAGAVGTSELVNGNRKRSRRLFVQSMLAPTGSALAQAEWATPLLGAEVIERRKATTATEPFEAFAFHLYREGQFSEVPERCERWAEVEPFSIRPFEFGSIAAGHAGQFAKAVELASEGLTRRPASALLLNCLAYALASADRVAEAEEALSKVVIAESEQRFQFLTTANRALVAFRKELPDEGIALYREAIEGFNRIGLKPSSAQARVYLAREAVRANHLEAKRFVKEAQEAMKPHPATEAARVLSRVEAAIGEKPRDVPKHVTPPGGSAVPQPLPMTEIRWTVPGWKGLAFK